MLRIRTLVPVAITVSMMDCKFLNKGTFLYKVIIIRYNSLVATCNNVCCSHQISGYEVCWHPVSQNCKICNHFYAVLSESRIFVLTIKYCKLLHFSFVQQFCSNENFHMFFTSRYIEAIRKLQSQGTTFLRTIHMTFVPGILHLCLL